MIVVRYVTRPHRYEDCLFSLRMGEPPANERKVWSEVMRKQKWMWSLVPRPIFQQLMEQEVRFFVACNQSPTLLFVSSTFFCNIFTKSLTALTAPPWLQSKSDRPSSSFGCLFREGSPFPRLERAVLPLRCSSEHIQTRRQTRTTNACLSEPVSGSEGLRFNPVLVPNVATVFELFRSFAIHRWLLSGVGFSKFVFLINGDFQ